MPLSPVRPALRKLVAANPRALIFDALLATLFLAMELPAIIIGRADGTISTSMPAVLLFALPVVNAAALLVRRNAALLSAAVAVPVGLVLSNAIPNFGVSSLVVGIALYSCGAYLPGWRAWLAGGAAALTYFGVTVIGQFDGSATSVLAATPVVIPIALVVVVGQLVRLRRELQARRRADGEREAVRAERRRIARELHDVVAHHITVMNVLVGGARVTFDSDAEAAKEALATAERMARQAMAEMRHLLDVLRADDSPDGPYVGAAQLPELVERSGLPVTLEITGSPRELPAAVDLTVYRLVQEALTNIRKHAGAVHGAVRLTFGPGEVEVEVTDDGPGPGRSGSGELSGHGLKGMAERVALCEGEFRSGALPGRGFRVFASIPVKEGQA